MRNLILAVVALAVGAFVFVSWKIRSDVAESVDMMVMMMSPYAVVDYDGVSATLTGELTVNGVRARVKGFTDEVYIDRIGIDTPSFLSLMALSDPQKLAASGGDALPKYFGLLVEGLRMPVNADYGHMLYDARLQSLNVSDADNPATECTGKYGLSPETLMAMGYREYDLSMSARFRDLGNDYAVEIAVESADMWSIDGELIIVGNLASTMALGSQARAKMRQMRFEYTDLSLNDRIRKYCRLRGLSDDEIHTAMLDSFEFMGRDNGIEFDEYVLDPFIEFLSGKETFILTAEPTEPVNLSQLSLYNPKDVPALLQLSAEAR